MVARFIGSERHEISLGEEIADRIEQRRFQFLPVEQAAFGLLAFVAAEIASQIEMLADPKGGHRIAFDEMVPVKTGDALRLIEEQSIRGSRVRGPAAKLLLTSTG